MTFGDQQPYLFPYIGYWQLMNISDIYVIADSVQFIKRGYINRNNILMNGKAHLFTLEVLGVHLGLLINEIEVGRNAEKVIKSIYYAYRKAPHFKEVFPMIEQILLNDEKNLAKYVGNSIESVARFLDMNTRFIYESDLQLDASLKAQAVIINIGKRLNADRYINAIGGQALYDKDSFLKEGIQLKFLKTGHIEYKQFNNEFVPNLSIIDVMMFNSKDKIKEMLTKYTLT